MSEERKQIGYNESQIGEEFALQTLPPLTLQEEYAQVIERLSRNEAERVRLHELLRAIEKKLGLPPQLLFSE